jgi:hypothetical protein
VLTATYAEKAKVERGVLCKHLDGKPLFTAVLCRYALMHREMRDSAHSNVFCEQKQTLTDEKMQNLEKTTTAAPAPRPQGEVPKKLLCPSED